MLGYGDIQLNISEMRKQRLVLAAIEWLTVAHKREHMLGR